MSFGTPFRTLTTATLLAVMLMACGSRQSSFDDYQSHGSVTTEDVDDTASSDGTSSLDLPYFTELPNFPDSVFFIQHSDARADMCDYVFDGSREGEALIEEARQCLRSVPRESRLAVIAHLGKKGLGEHFTMSLEEARGYELVTIGVSLRGDHPTTPQEYLAAYTALHQSLAKIVGTNCQNMAAVFPGEAHNDRNALLVEFMMMASMKDLGCSTMGVELDSETSYHTRDFSYKGKNITCRVEAPGLSSILQKMASANWKDAEEGRIFPESFTRNGSDPECFEPELQAPGYVPNQVFLAAFALDIGLRATSYDDDFNEAAFDPAVAGSDERNLKMFATAMQMLRTAGTAVVFPVGGGHLDDFAPLCNKSQYSDVSCHFMQGFDSMSIYTEKGPRGKGLVGFNRERMPEMVRAMVEGRWRHFLIPGQGVSTAVEARQVALWARATYKNITAQ